MYTRNVDTGKWFNQIDSLPKDIYDGLREDFDKVRLYSKCLSGATYLPIKSFDDIYDTLGIEKIGYYINEPLSQPDPIRFGPSIPLNSSNSDEFYNKYLKENAFTIKNLFTPNKLINDQYSNYLYVDVATVFSIPDVGAFLPGLTIDGIKLKEGQLVLVKDQINEVNLAITVDPEVYFSTVQLSATYSQIILTNTPLFPGAIVAPSSISGNVFTYFNNENGIYEYRDNRLQRIDLLDDYDNCYRYSITVGLGEVNRERQFHLMRLSNGYYPITGQNMAFEEAHNWILRNRVDYNNIFDLNFYDILHHDAQEVYYDIEGKTYSIPARSIAVGEFGAIINNQDTLSGNATHSISNIMNNKFKVNLRSICQVDNYYWICGDENTILRVSKKDYSIRRVILDERVDFTSISFWGNLDGFIVGKFNTMYWTSNGGFDWDKIVIPEFEGYSYTKVLHVSQNQVFVGGESGVFIEMTYTNGSWISYKRKISKLLAEDDEYLLVDDINDLSKTNWINIYGTFSLVETSASFRDSLVLEWKLISGMRLEISISSKFFGNPVFENSVFYIATNIQSIYSNLYYNSVTFPSSPYTSYDLYKVGSDKKYKFTITLPASAIDPNTGNLINTSYLFRSDVIYNYDGATNTVQSSLIKEGLSATISTTEGKIVLISGNQNNVICYDVDNVINGQSDFIYFTATQSFSDVKTIARRPSGRDVYIGGDKIYKFDFSQFLNFGATYNNSTGTFSFVADYYANKLSLTNDTIYMAGNNSNLRFAGYTNSQFNLLDPTFGDKFKSKLLFLDYDIASKLNFFTDEGEYRLANPISVTFSLGNQLSLTNVVNERNWINYYKDSIKTFRYYSSMTDIDRVEFSTTFSFSSNSSYSFQGSDINTNLLNILPLAPNITSMTASRYIAGTTPIVTPSAVTRFRVFLYKWLVIFQTSMTVSVGDVLRWESDVIDVNLIVNRIELFNVITNQKLIYCFTDFNDNIIRNLVANSGFMTVTNLNRYSKISELVERFEKHPISWGYQLEEAGAKLKISQRFNSKTAYYNMRTSASVNTQSYIMNYEESFLDFGYSPTYNILDYLNKINPNEFDSNSAFSIMPRYYNMPGNNGNSFTQSNIYIDLEEGPIIGTVSYVRTGTNKVIFGENFKFHWESLLLNTFIDLDMNSTLYGLVTNERMLIAKKYIDEETGGYAIEFHKKIQVPITIPVNFYDVDFFNFRSRNRLSQISEDLQLLNNIQRTSSQRSVEYLVRFTNLENELYKKFPTDSYFKVLASDYRIRKRLSAIIYTDYKYELAMNIMNLEKEKKYSVSNMIPIQGYAGFANPKVRLEISSEHDVEVGDLIFIELTGGSFSSQVLNTQYSGLHTVLETFSTQGYGWIMTSLDYGQQSFALDTATISIIKSDPFLNYLPVDLIDLGLDLKVKRAIAIEPENIKLVSNKYNLVNLDLNRYRYELMDGLTLQEISDYYPWVLEAEISDAIIGRDENGIVWYSGDWLCGRWFGGTWYSGRWVSGDWYAGEWYSFNTINRVISVQIDKSYSDSNLSKWYNGRWFDGTWYDGNWYNGRRYAGDWNDGLWFNGIWNDGNWLNGQFSGGVWVLGTWRDGIFNSDSKPSYWLDGKFEAGDFENGIWYNGQFGNTDGKLSRFGTRSSGSRPSLWHSGRWTDGEFYSKRVVDDITGEVVVSDIHRWSVWKTGLWAKGSFWGGVVYNIDFRNGTWYGGILEEIQVIGIDRILPAASSNNAIVLNGDFRFNIGDEIWLIDDDRNVGFSPLGNNTTPRKYRINKIEELDDKKTRVFLNYNLSSLRVDTSLASATYSNVETGLRVVSNFKNGTWKSGIWTNGIFEDGNFEAGIWFNGLFSGTWGI